MYRITGKLTGLIFQGQQSTKRLFFSWTRKTVGTYLGWWIKIEFLQNQKWKAGLIKILCSVPTIIYHWSTYLHGWTCECVFRHVSACICACRVSRGKMEPGGKMEHPVFGNKYEHARYGYVVVSVWFRSLARVAWHDKIKLVDDHILNTTQKRNFPIFEHVDVSIYSRSGVDCLYKVGHRTTESCLIELFTSFTYFLVLCLSNKGWNYSWHDALHSNVIPGCKMEHVTLGIKWHCWGKWNSEILDIDYCDKLCRRNAECGWI